MASRLSLTKMNLAASSNFILQRRPVTPVCKVDGFEGLADQNELNGVQ